MPEVFDRKLALSDLEAESVGVFIGFLKLVGLPKSIGEIYGLLFVSPRALAMDEIMERLGMSLGAASQGLKVLRSVGAVRTVYKRGDRRDHYEADLELSRFATAFLRDEVRPRLQGALERVGTMEEMAGEMEEGDGEEARERLRRLRHWLEKGERMMPWILRFLVR
jgi:HTH-type transcriptional regulator, glycine betaine synthesis regulator